MVNVKHDKTVGNRQMKLKSVNIYSIHLRNSDEVTNDNIVTIMALNCVVHPTSRLNNNN